jgi:hypothetical protein
VSLPPALLCPTPLLLPREGLLLVPARLLRLRMPRALLLLWLLLLPGLLDALLLLWLLLLLPGWCGALLLRLLCGRIAPLLALAPLFPAALVLLRLRALRLCGWRGALPAPVLLLFRPAAPLVLLFFLRERSDMDSEKQTHRGGAANQSELHRIVSVKAVIRQARGRPARLNRGSAPRAT